MYSNKNNNYYRINHEKNLDFFDPSSFAQLKSLFFCELGEIDTTTILNNKTILFNSILKCNNLKDTYEIINQICDQFIKSYDDSLSIYLCQKLSKKNFNMVFTFSRNNIIDVATVLSIGFKKFYKSQNKNINYEKFIENIGKYSNMRLDMIPFYKNYISNNNNYENNIIVDVQRYDIPNELLLLIDIFQKIKKIEFKIGDYTKEINLGFYLILLNYKWLFPYVFEIEFDLNNIDLNNEFQKIYIQNLKDKIGINYDNIKNGDEVENNNLDNNINKIKNISNIFDLIIMYTYFIDKFKFLNNLEIKIPNSFKKEINDHLNSQKMNIGDMHILQFFSSINNLNFLKIEFNALDSITFENIFSLIQNNSNLKYLSLDFFPNEKQYKNYYTISNLYKLKEDNYNDMNKIHKKISKLSYDSISNKEELKKNLLNQLMDNFENNMEKLFILLQTKKNLDELFLIFNESNLFSDINNEQYYLILLKFIYNIFIMINNENMNLKSIKIISKYFQFNNNKNNTIDQFLNGINFNKKNKYLINFELQLQINNILKISNIISYNFKILYLGFLDKISLKNFILFYKEKKFVQNSQLFSLTLELNENIKTYKECKEELIELIKSECPYKLSEIGLFCHFNINEIDLVELIMNGNGNCVNKYIFKIKGNIENKNAYYKLINEKNIYYINKNYKYNINRYLGLIIKYKFYIGEKAKIGKKLIKFLIPNNRKIIEIYFI